MTTFLTWRVYNQLSLQHPGLAKPVGLKTCPDIIQVFKSQKSSARSKRKQFSLQFEKRDACKVAMQTLYAENRLKIQTGENQICLQLQPLDVFVKCGGFHLCHKLIQWNSWIQSLATAANQSQSTNSIEVRIGRTPSPLEIYHSIFNNHSG